jgi:hypothetical protein
LIVYFKIILLNTIRMNMSHTENINMAGDLKWH